MATKLDTNNYSKINNDITDLMRTGLYSGAMINIYTDSAGTVFARDGNAPIEHSFDIYTVLRISIADD